METYQSIPQEQIAGTKAKIMAPIALAAIATIIFITLITIFADLFPAIKGLLKNTFSHHWVGKSVLSLAIFLITFGICYLCPHPKTIEKVKKLLPVLIWASIISSVAIFIFFIWEAFFR